MDITLLLGLGRILQRMILNLINKEIFKIKAILEIT